MSLESIADQKACVGSNGINTGKLGCLSLFGSVEHALLIPKGHKIPAATVFNLAYISPEVQKGNIIPLIGASAFEDVSAEDAYSTNSSTVKRLNIKGLPEYRLTFEEGHEYYKQLSKLESFKSYDVILGDENGNWMMKKYSDGAYGGFSAGHVTPELTSRKVKGGDSEMKAVLMQFIDRLEWDRNYAIVHYDAPDIDFIPSEFPVVNGVDLSFNVTPVATDTTIQVKAVLEADHHTLVEGLAAANFRIYVNGVTEIPSTLTESNPGIYSITLGAALASSDVISVELWDDTLKADVIDNSGTLYRGDTDGDTVIA